MCLAALISMGSWLVITAGLGIATLFAAVAAGLVWVGQHRQSRQVRRRRATVAAALPVLMLLWFLPAWVIWTGWGAATRLHTPCAGDDSRSRVQLPNGYTLLLARRWWMAGPGQFPAQRKNNSGPLIDP